LEGPKYGRRVSQADCRPYGLTKSIAKEDVKQVVLDVPEDLRDYFAAQCDPSKELQKLLPDVQAKFDHQSSKLKVMVSDLQFSPFAPIFLYNMSLRDKPGLRVINCGNKASEMPFKSPLSRLKKDNFYYKYYFLL
jgi:hypothetical protein